MQFFNEYYQNYVKDYKFVYQLSLLICKIKISLLICNAGYFKTNINLDI